MIHFRKTLRCAVKQFSKVQMPPAVPYMFQTEWSAEGHLQHNRPPTMVHGKQQPQTQMEWLDEAQYRLKGYWLAEASEALDQARTCEGSDPTVQRQLLLDMVLFCKQKKGNLAMEACIKMLKRYPMFSTDPVGLANLGTLFGLNQDYPRAIEVLEQVPRDHAVWHDQAASWLAEAYSMLEQHAKAEPIMAQICNRYEEMKEERIQEELHKAATDPETLDLDEHNWTCLRIKNLQLWAGMLMQLERNEEGVKVMKRAVADAIRIMGHEDVITAGAKNMLGIGLLRCGAVEEALGVLEEGTQFLEQRLTLGDANTLSALELLRLYSAKSGKDTEALRASQRHLRMALSMYETGSVEVISSTINVTRHLMSVGQYADAVGLLATVEHQAAGKTADVRELLRQCQAALGKGEMGETPG